MDVDDEAAGQPTSPPGIHGVQQAGEWDPSSPIKFADVSGDTQSSIQNDAAALQSFAEELVAMSQQAPLPHGAHPDSPQQETPAHTEAAETHAEVNAGHVRELEQLIDAAVAADSTIDPDLLSPVEAVVKPQEAEEADHVDESADNDRRQSRHVSIQPEPEVISVVAPPESRHASIEVAEFSDDHRFSESEHVRQGEVMSSSRGSSIVREDDEVRRRALICPSKMS